MARWTRSDRSRLAMNLKGPLQDGKVTCVPFKELKRLETWLKEKDDESDPDLATVPSLPISSIATPSPSSSPSSSSSSSSSAPSAPPAPRSPPPPLVPPDVHWKAFASCAPPPCSLIDLVGRTRLVSTYFGATGMRNLGNSCYM